MSPTPDSQKATVETAFIGDLKMTTNLGIIDRMFRAVLGLILIAVPFVSGAAVFDGGAATVVSIAVGIVMLATSAMRFCPLYRIFGIRTCKL
jgi:hypothetical protein